MAGLASPDIKPTPPPAPKVETPPTTPERTMADSPPEGLMTAKTETPGADPDNLTSTDIVTEGAEIVKENPGLNLERIVHEFIASGGKEADLFIKKAQNLKAEAGEDPAKLADALDLEIAGLQQKESLLVEQYQKMKLPGAKLNQWKHVAPAKIEAQIQDVRVRRWLLAEQRSSKTTKDQPNKLAIIVTGLGLDSSQPLVALHQKLKAIVKDKSSQDPFYARLKALGVESNIIEQVKQSVKHDSRVDKGKKIGRVGILVGLAALVMGYLATKSDKNRQG